MNSKIIFWLMFAALTALILYFNAKYGMLRDESVQVKKKPYSYARTQLTWWTVIVLSGFATVILYRHEIPTFTPGVLILLGISSATTIAARITDNADQEHIEADRLSQNSKGQNFLVDILSDKSGVSIHRLQSVLFNIVIGLWFINQTLANIANSTIPMNEILPDLEQNNLILIGLSAGTYVALKTTENKNTSGSKSDKTTIKVDEKNENDIPPVA